MRSKALILAFALVFLVQVVSAVDDYKPYLHNAVVPEHPEIKLFEKSGGHVTHQKRNPFITAIIGMMPLFGCSAFLLILAYIFSAIGVEFYSTTLSSSNSNFLLVFWDFLVIAAKTFYDNFVPFDIIQVIFFILFLYFVGSVAATIAPSGTDLKHSFVGLVIILILGIITIYLHPLSYVPGITEQFNSNTPILNFIVDRLTYAIGIGMIGVFLILLILIPIALLKK